MAVTVGYWIRCLNMVKFKEHYNADLYNMFFLSENLSIIE